MKIYKKLNYLLIGASTLALISSPLLTIIGSSTNFIANRNLENRGQNVGFDIFSPIIKPDNDNEQIMSLKNGFIENAYTKTIPLYSTAYSGNINAGSNTSKTFLYDENFVLNFAQPIIPNPPTTTNISALPIGGISTKETTYFSLVEGTGSPFTPFESSVVNQSGVVSAQLTGDNLWLLTHGKFGNPAVEGQYILQAYKVNYNGASVFFVPMGNSKIIPFQGDASTRLNINPPVLSPVYETSQNGDVTIIPNKMIVWQQNLDFNTQVSGVAQEFSILNGQLTLPVIIDTIKIPTSVKTLALTAIDDAAGVRNYYIHHTDDVSKDINISHLTALPTSELTTFPIAKNIDTTGIEVENQISYAKIVKNTLKTNELVWVLPQNATQATVFSTSIIDSQLTPDHNTKYQVLPNLKKIEYIDIGSFANDNSLLSLKVQGLSNLTTPAMFNLSQLKNAPQGTNNSFLTEIAPKVNFQGTPELWNSTLIAKVDEKGILFLSYHNNQNNSVQGTQLRSLDLKTSYNTIVPSEIITRIGELDGDTNGAKPIAKFSKDTPPENLATIISRRTNNLIHIFGPISGAITIDTDSSSFNEDEGSWKVHFEYRNGIYKDGLRVISEPKIVTLFQQPASGGGFIPLSYSLNIPLIGESTPQSFADKINAITGVDGSLPEGFQNLSDFQGIIGYQETDIIQISQAYLSSLSSIKLIPDNQKGTLSIDLIFNNNNNIVSFTVEGFYGDYIADQKATEERNLIISTTVPIIIIVTAIILIIVFVILQKKKKDQLSKTLAAGFALNKKMGTKTYNKLHDKKNIRSIPPPGQPQVRKPIQQNNGKNASSSHGKSGTIIPPFSPSKK